MPIYDLWLWYDKLENSKGKKDGYSKTLHLLVPYRAAHHRFAIVITYFAAKRSRAVR